MRTSSTRRLAVALLPAIALACSGSSRSAVRTSPSPSIAGEPTALQQSERAAIARARADSARYPYTAADIHFMSGMIGHHAQAITMARWAPSHGASASVRTLAERIINAQQDEIVTMQRWLRDRQQPVPDPNAGPMKMMMNGVEEEMLMPGMLTDDQMKQLDAARGADFDKLFLTDMIQHHRGALQMVKELFGSYGAGQDELVFKFASDVNVDQTTEIARMQRMLFALAIQQGSQ
ncbi:MAG TPA: DUF305 domain-containing protein [Gemmatimonadaceae bacterium]|nr:DUF305 domain-containing protein [Gemmatimonadaceae bacterium]